MFDIRDLPPVRAILWQNLRPGMIIAGGITINDTVPYELRDYPVVTDDLLNDLYRKYQFLGGRRVLILDTESGDIASARSASLRLQDLVERNKKLNVFRSNFVRLRQEIMPRDVSADVPVLKSELVERSSLILDRWSSFQMLSGQGPELPSFLNRVLETVTVGDILTKQVLSKFNFPEDEEVVVHLVIDYSYSMKATGRDFIARHAAQMLVEYMCGFLRNTRVNLYAFSELCRPVSLPLNGDEVPRGDTLYSSFIRKVLHMKVPGLRNHLILISDGKASDEIKSLPEMQRLAKAGIDYTQIVLSLPRESEQRVVATGGSDGYIAPDAKAGTYSVVPRSREDFQQELGALRAQFNAYAGAAKGNLIILTNEEVTGLVTVECFDRYLGSLTRALRKQDSAQEMEAVTERPRDEKVRSQRVRNWKPPPA